MTWPIDTDGVQAITVDAPGWTWQPLPTVFTTARDVERHITAMIDDLTRYTDHIEFTYYGFDPTVADDDGTVFGTDGYPDAIGRYDPTTETVIWEQA